MILVIQTDRMGPEAFSVQINVTIELTLKFDVKTNANIKWPFRARLHQASESRLRQHCDDASDTVFIENNRVAPEWGCNPFLE